MIGGIELSTLAIVLLLALGGYLAVAALLILSQRPGPPIYGDTLDFDALEGASPDVPILMHRVLARDGMPVDIRRYDGLGASAPLLILVHGSGWHGRAYHDLAHAIAATGAAEVVVPDLRGHGPHPFRRGDVDHIGQLEEDLCDVIKAYGGADRRVFMLGHSSGGGLAVRFAGGRYGAMLSKVVLLAPFLQHDAPTTRPNAGGWAHPLVRRIIGISMLNKIGITALNGLHIISFAFPRKVLDGPEGDTATTSYSYRLNASFAPRRNYLRDVAALPEFCVITGADDDAFVAEAYEPLMSAVNPRGTYHVLPGENHLDIVRSPTAARIAADFLLG